MNDLLRPSLYRAYHEIVPVRASDESSEEEPHETVDVVGPICETGDFFARDRELPIDAGRRFAGTARRWRLRNGAGLQLQYSAASGGGVGGWEIGKSDPAARDYCGSGSRRN